MIDAEDPTVRRNIPFFGAVGPYVKVGGAVVGPCVKAGVVRICRLDISVNFLLCRICIFTELCIQNTEYHVEELVWNRNLFLPEIFAISLILFSYFVKSPELIFIFILYQAFYF
jgi:hypothetical protein